MKILITGAAGFIGAHTANTLVQSGYSVFGIDNFNSYYNPLLKFNRINSLAPNIEVIEGDLNNLSFTSKYLALIQPDIIIHLAAQPGVRRSFQCPNEYLQNNINTHFNILNSCRGLKKLKKLIYASSSSIYGDIVTFPTDENNPGNSSTSIYATSKKTCELISAAFAKNYGINQVGLRFFSIYGPWGRPDMSYWKFAKSILKGKPIKLYNFGNMHRSFTYIKDVTEAIHSIVKSQNHPDHVEVNHSVYNVGINKTYNLHELVNALELNLNKTAIIEKIPCPFNETLRTHAKNIKIKEAYNASFTTELNEGIKLFSNWFVNFADNDL